MEEIIMNKPKIIMQSDHAGHTYFLKEVEDLPRNISVTKALGGKAIVNTSRWWCHHGYGSWVTEWFILKNDADKAKESLKSFGIESEWLERQ